ncbi:MAG: ABC transporter permease, partial [Clostridia bacterium]|nr:ABC transporter permease [Clostridia bacterium]
GAGWAKKLFRITIPLCSPTIFFNLVLNIIGTLQVFDLAFIFKNPLNEKSLNFFVVYIYNQAFGILGQMGYASALSWVLFAIIAVLAAVVFKTNKWVYYGENTD